MARDKSLEELLARLTDRSNAYLFGGVLRDIAITGGVGLGGSDIDIVHEPYQKLEMDGVLDGVNCTRNKFGGMRIETELWKVDLWHVRDTWAFQRGLVQYSGVESILETTITNWESVLYRLKGGKVICDERYFSDIGNRRLDLVLRDNPNPLGMCVRILRQCSLREDVSLSVDDVVFLKEAMAAYSSEDICDYEVGHYPKAHIDRTGADSFRDLLEDADGEKGGARMGIRWGSDDLFGRHGK